MTPTFNEADARVRFWTEYMERSRQLIEGMEQYPLAECGEPLASIPDAARAAGVEMLFSTTKLAGLMDRIFHIRKGLIDDLLQIARAMNERGWILKIEEGFRTAEMQTTLGRSPLTFDRILRMCVWECGGKVPPRELVFRRAKCLVAIIPCTGTHLCGAAVDVSVFRRDDGTEVWRGKPYLEMSEYTPMDSPFVTAQEHENRREITRLMEQQGFLHYPGEFWHYNQGDVLYQMLSKSGQPGRYGPIHWNPETGEVTPFTDVHAPLTPPDVFKQLITDALQRIEDGR